MAWLLILILAPRNKILPTRRLMETNPPRERRVPHTCPLCEATCGLDITLRGDEILRIRGDKEDVFSKGFV